MRMRLTPAEGGLSAALPMLRKLLSKRFWPKAIIAFLIFFQFVGLFLLFLYLSDWSGLSPEWSGIAVIIVYGIGVVFAFYCFNSESSIAYKLSWVFVVLAFPGAGSFLYLIFGNKQNSRRKARLVKRFVTPYQRDSLSPEEWDAIRKEHPYAYPLASYLHRVKGIVPYQKSSVEYFPLGDAVFEPILAELRKARHFIFIEFFIIESDGVFFSSILEILKQKAQAGLDIRIVYDDVGCLTTLPSSFGKDMALLNIKAKPFNEFRPFLDVRQNNRDHRKMIIIDGHTAFTGGFNLADEYINRKPRFGHWKDNGILVRGKAVEGYTNSFLATYESLDPSKPGEFDKAKYASSAYIEEIGGYPKTAGYVEPYDDTPLDGETVGERVYLSLIQRANDYVYMATPYLLIDEEMENSLCAAAKSGVDVRLLTPHIPDKKAVFNLTRSYYRRLLQAGVRIYEYTPGFVHEKMFIADDKMATVGTINLDYRSLFLHFENGTFLFGSPAIKNMKRDYLDTLSLSKEVDRATYERWYRKNKYYWALLRIAAPFL